MSGADARAANAMLRRLRVKFVALSMTVVTLALVAALSAIGYLDYRQSVDDVYGELRQTVNLAAQLSADRGGHPFGGSVLFPNGHGPFGDRLRAEAKPDDDAPGDGEDEPPADAGEDAGSRAEGPAEPEAPLGPEAVDPPANEGSEGAAVLGDDAPTPPEIGRGDAQGLTPMAVYHVGTGGEAAVLGRLTTASVPADLLPDALAAVLSSNSEQGYLADQGLYFAQRRTAGGVLVAFADRTAASSWRSLALTLAVVGGGALLLFLAVSILFARWALRPVERAWDQQQRFVADASHELKTPLTVILANLAIVRSHGDEPVASQDQWLAGTEVEARRMQALVGDLLDLARTPDPAALRAGFSAVDLTDLVEGEALQFDAVALDRGVSVECALTPAVRVEGDGARLERLVGVLIDNACKYAEPGTEVSVALGVEGREAVLSVANRGPLIAPEDLGRVFDRFFRVDAARTRAGSADPDAPQAGGYGLGLAIAREIARDHGGSIAATSAPLAPGPTGPDGGAAALTTFTVRLPRS